jgi:beta-lactamase class A
MAVTAFDPRFDRAGCDGSLHAVRLSNGVEIAHDADRPSVSASVVKVPIGLEFYAAVDAGTIDPARPVTLVPGQRTPGPTGSSQFGHPATISIGDLAGLMLAVSDNAATDVVTEAIGIEAVNRRLTALGCHDTLVTGTLQALFDGVAADLGFADYDELLAAQHGERGPSAQATATDQDRIGRCRALDPEQTTRTTARDATRLLTAIWADRAASPMACARLRSAMAHQVAHRFRSVMVDGGSLAAKSGSLFGRVRNEIGVVTDPDGESYAVAVLTTAHRPFVGQSLINSAMAAAVGAALDQLRN